MRVNVGTYHSSFTFSSIIHIGLFSKIVDRLSILLFSFLDSMKPQCTGFSSVPMFTVAYIVSVPSGVLAMIFCLMV